MEEILTSKFIKYDKIPYIHPRQMECLMIMQTTLVQHLPTKKIRRYYTLHTTPTLFGEWALVHTWGKIGRKGRCKEEWYPSSKEANHAAGMILAQKTQMGYKQRPVQLKLF